VVVDGNDSIIKTHLKSGRGMGDVPVDLHVVGHFVDGLEWHVQSGVQSRMERENVNKAARTARGGKGVPILYLTGACCGARERESVRATYQLGCTRFVPSFAG